MTKAQNIRKTYIDDRLDQVQKWMETNHHMKSEEANLEVWDVLLKLIRIWGVLSEEDREYVECAKDAVLERRKWIL